MGECDYSMKTVNDSELSYLDASPVGCRRFSKFFDVRRFLDLQTSSIFSLLCPSHRQHPQPSCMLLPAVVLPRLNLRVQVDATYGTVQGVLLLTLRGIGACPSPHTAIGSGQRQSCESRRGGRWGRGGGGGSGAKDTEAAYSELLGAVCV